MPLTNILFVCTGNICRSPLAEVAARSLFGNDSFVFSSAGTHAVAGNAATRNMQVVASERALDLSIHTAMPLADCTQPHIVYGMEQHHLVAARRQFPDLDVSRIRLLDHPNAIVDPYGLDIGDYRIAADRIVETLESLDLR
ncbi:MAG: low molecular weight phosphotyrosine protein phosphatase [Acidimicrobiia bacterium]